MPADATMVLSVVIERRAANSPWQDYVWHPVGVLPRVSGEVGKLLAEDEGWAQYLGGTLELELFRGETEGYLTNLSQTTPYIYVVLRRDDEDETLEYKPFLITACPYEAMGYSDGNDDIVEGVPMLPAVADWVRAFVTAHHVDTPFIKRKNRRHVDNHGGMGPRAGADRETT